MEKQLFSIHCVTVLGIRYAKINKIQYLLSRRRHFRGKEKQVNKEVHAETVESLDSSGREK